MSQIQLIYLFVYCVTAIDFIESKPSFTYYDKIPTSNSTFSMTLTADRSDLAATYKYFPEFDPHHMCMDGIWVVYWGGEDYGSGQYGYVPEIHYDKCTGVWQLGSPGSLRIAGEVGVKRLNLYSDGYYHFNATSIFEDQATVIQFRSMILVGSTPVEMFRLPNFGGLFSYCLRGSSSYVTVSDIVGIGIQPGDIKSLRFGCSSSSKMIELVPNK